MAGVRFSGRICQLNRGKIHKARARTRTRLHLLRAELRPGNWCEDQAT
jgi:hypothetical protein